MLNATYEITLLLVPALLDGPESQRPTVEDTTQVSSIQ